MVRKTLLVCGPLSSVLYAAMTVLVAAQWSTYRSMDQTISELSAIDAPTRSLWLLPGVAYTLLVLAFACGVWISANGDRALRRARWPLAVYALLGLLWPFAPMHLREVLAAGGGTMSDTLHLVLAGVTVALMFLAIICAAPAFGRGFRRYSIASVLVLVVCGALTFVGAPRVGANLPTPWLGLWERINVGVFLVWVMALSTMLLRHRDQAQTNRPRQLVA